MIHRSVFYIPLMRGRKFFFTAKCLRRLDLLLLIIEFFTWLKIIQNKRDTTRKIKDTVITTWEKIIIYLNIFQPNGTRLPFFSSHLFPSKSSKDTLPGFEEDVLCIGEILLSGLSNRLAFDLSLASFKPTIHVLLSGPSLLYAATTVADNYDKLARAGKEQESFTFVHNFQNISGLHSNKSSLVANSQKKQKDNTQK